MKNRLINASAKWQAPCEKHATKHEKTYWEASLTSYHLVNQFYQELDTRRCY